MNLLRQKIKTDKTKNKQSLPGIEKLKKELTKKEREAFFCLFNDFFQLEFMIFEIGFIKLEWLFKYVSATNRIFQKYLKKELAIDNCPEIGIELLVNKKLNWKKIPALEKKYNTRITSIHSPLEIIHDSVWGKLSRNIFNSQLRGDFCDKRIREAIKNIDVPLTVHASQMEKFKASGLNKQKCFRIENDSVFKCFSEGEINAFCSPESIIKMAKDNNAGLVFDTYHFYSYYKHLAKISEKNSDRLLLLSDIIDRKIILGDKFHLSEGKNGGRGLTDRHMSINSGRGKINTRYFLENYDFFRQKKSYLTLEINPLEKGARMMPRRVMRYYAKNFIFIIDCLAINMLKDKYKK